MCARCRRGKRRLGTCQIWHLRMRKYREAVGVRAALTGIQPFFRAATRLRAYAKISAMVLLLAVLQSRCDRYSRIRRNCSSRGSSFQAAMSASLGVAEGMTLLARLSVSLMSFRLAGSSEFCQIE